MLQFLRMGSLLIVGFILTACGGGGSDPKPVPVPSSSAAALSSSDSSSSTTQLSSSSAQSSQEAHLSSVAQSASSLLSQSSSVHSSTQTKSSSSVHVIVSSSSSIAGSSSSHTSDPTDVSSSSSSMVVLTGKLNDTGINWCRTPGTNNTESCTGKSGIGHDGLHGYDAKPGQKMGGGLAGFDFTKLDVSGNSLPANASTWSCVRDNRTGLIWEIKTRDGGLRDIHHTYTWYNPDNNTNGGFDGYQDGGVCHGSDCDTHAYVQTVNTQGLCGANDWSLPTGIHLTGLIHMGGPAGGFEIDTHYFPDVQAGGYWSSAPYAKDSDKALSYSFDYDVGTSGARSKGERYSIRLVRAGQ